MNINYKIRDNTYIITWNEHKIIMFYSTKRENKKKIAKPSKISVEYDKSTKGSSKIVKDTTADDSEFNMILSLKSI